MRIRQDRINSYIVFRRDTVRDAEANTHDEYVKCGIVSGVLYKPSGSTKALMYGEKLAYMKTIKIDDKWSVSGQKYVVDGTEIQEGYALAIDSEEANYRIKAIRAERYLYADLEKI